MMMMTPDPDRLRWGIDSLVTLNVPVRLILRTASQASGSVASTGAVGPEMPALFTSTSSPPSVSAAALTSRSTAGRSDTSHTVAVIDGSAWVRARSAFSAMSQICTLAPSAAKARAIANPIPLPPAVTRTRFPVCMMKPR
jgi:hypothetical protein